MASQPLLSVNIRGLSGLQRGFRLFPRFANNELFQGMEKITKHVQDRMATYPPQRPTNYRRTGTYGRSVTSAVQRRFGGRIEGSIGSNVRYAPFLKDPERQARMHQGHWPTAEDDVRASLPFIERTLNQSGSRIVAKVADEVRRSKMNERFR